MLGNLNKHGLGFRNLNKSYVQYFCQRDGPVILEPYPNPKGGAEALYQIKDLLDDKVAPYSNFHSDKSRGVRAWVSDNSDLNLVHVIVNHALAKFYGFTWNLYVDEIDGYGFEHLKINEGKYDIIRAGTQHADGYASLVKKAFSQRGYVQRHLVKSELKEVQWRTNERCGDVFLAFLQAWCELETDLRDDFCEVDLPFVENLVNWDHHSYENAPDSYPCWICPGCGFNTEGISWKKERTTHKKSCKYYNLTPLRQYDHATSRCTCCIYSYHNSSQLSKIKITHYESALKAIAQKKKIKKKKKKTYECPTCNAVFTDGPANRYQHRSHSWECFVAYQKGK